MASQTEVDDMIKRIQTSKGVQGEYQNEIFIDQSIDRLTNFSFRLGLMIIDSEGIPIRTSMDNETTLHYAALISQLIIHAKRVVRELDPTQELEQLRKFFVIRFDSILMNCFSSPHFLLGLRSHKHEIIVAPESKYIMIVVQVPDAF